MVVAVAEISGGSMMVSQTSTNDSGYSATSTSQNESALGFTLGDSQGDSFVMVGQAPGQPGNSYTFYYFVANVSTDGTDQVTLTGSGNFPFIFVHELTGVNDVVGFSSGLGNSTNASVSAFAPPIGSLVLATIWVENNQGIADATVEAGSGGFILLDSAFAVSEESGASTNAMTSLTSPFTLSNAVPWSEISIALD